MRYEDFSGDLIDQEVLRHVLSNLDAEPAGTAAVAALGRTARPVPDRQGRAQRSRAPPA